MRFLFYSLFMVCMLFSAAHAATPQQGDKLKDGMVFLYREKVEIYWNDWTAKQLSGSKIYIAGEGKTAGFEGIVSLNCDSASGYSWITASNDRRRLGISEAEIKEAVPIQALSSAFTLFCPAE